MSGATSLAAVDEYYGESASDNSIPDAATFALLWYATLGTVKQQEHLVKNLLLAGSLAVVFGESNSGKTFWILDMALAIAAGGQWRGRRVQRGLVLYVAGEGSASVRARVAAWRKTHAEVSGLPFAIIPQAVDFLNPESIATLLTTIRAAESESGEKAVLIVVDTFARAIPGGDENSAKDVGSGVAASDLIRTKTGSCVCFIHHAGKDPTKGARGSSSLRAATDTEVLIEGLTGIRTATVTKQRDLEGGAAMPFELVQVEVGIDPEDDTSITSCVVKQLDGDTAGAAPQALREFRGKAQRQFLNAMRARSKKEPERIWTLAELREVGTDLGMTKSTRRSVVDAMVTSPYMQMTAFGYRFTDGGLKVEKG